VVGGQCGVDQTELTRGRVGFNSWYVWMETSLDFNGRRRRCDLLRVCEVCGVVMVVRLEGTAGVRRAEGVMGGEDVYIGAGRCLLV
jgi:hypothetical protein